MFFSVIGHILFANQCLSFLQRSNNYNSQLIHRRRKNKNQLRITHENRTGDHRNTEAGTTKDNQRVFGGPIELDMEPASCHRKIKHK